jgi:hypothetical protein
MVSWGPTRADGEKFYSGEKNAPPWVRDLNWKNQCKQETQMLEKRRTLKAMTMSGSMSSKSMKRSTKGGRTTIKMKVGSHGAMVPDEPDDVLLEKLAFQQESKRPKKIFQLQPESSSRQWTGRASARSTGRSTGRSSGKITGRSTARSTARSTGRSSARSLSTIGSMNTEMRDIIRETASTEIQELRQALALESKLRAESDAKIDKLCNELVAMREKESKK